MKNFTRLLGKKIRDSVDDFLYKKLDRGEPFSFLKSISKWRINNLPAVLQISWPAAASSAAGTSKKICITLKKLVRTLVL